MLPAILAVHAWVLPLAPARGERRAELARLAPFAGVLALYLVARFTALGGFAPAEPLLRGVPFEIRLHTLGSVFLEYLRLLVFPGVLQTDFYYREQLGIAAGATARSLCGLALLAPGRRGARLAAAARGPRARPARRAALGARAQRLRPRHLSRLSLPGVAPARLRRADGGALPVRALRRIPAARGAGGRDGARAARRVARAAPRRRRRRWSARWPWRAGCAAPRAPRNGAMPWRSGSPRIATFRTTPASGPTWRPPASPAASWTPPRRCWRRASSATPITWRRSATSATCACSRGASRRPAARSSASSCWRPATSSPGTTWACSRSGASGPRMRSPVSARRSS